MSVEPGCIKTEFEYNLDAAKAEEIESKSAPACVKITVFFAIKRVFLLRLWTLYNRWVVVLEQIQFVFQLVCWIYLQLRLIYFRHLRELKQFFLPSQFYLQFFLEDNSAG